MIDNNHIHVIQGNKHFLIYLNNLFLLLWLENNNLIKFESFFSLNKLNLKLLLKFNSNDLDTIFNKSNISVNDRPIIRNAIENLKNEINKMDNKKEKNSTTNDKKHENIEINENNIQQNTITSFAVCIYIFTSFSVKKIFVFLM